VWGIANVVAGKSNAIEVSGGGAQTEPPQRCGHAPMFARPGEPEPNCVVGERLQPASSRPRPEASRTIAEARAIGLTMPEALDLTADKVAGWFPPAAQEDAAAEQDGTAPPLSATEGDETAAGG
jgi:hypothetical protein